MFGPRGGLCRSIAGLFDASSLGAVRRKVQCHMGEWLVKEMMSR